MEPRQSPSLTLQERRRLIVVRATNDRRTDPYWPFPRFDQMGRLIYVKWLVNKGRIGEVLR